MKFQGRGDAGGALLAAVYFKGQADETRDALERMQKRQASVPLPGDEARIAHYRRNLDYFEYRARGIRSLLAEHDRLVATRTVRDGWRDFWHGIGAHHGWRHWCGWMLAGIVNGFLYSMFKAAICWPWWTP